jgi:hypothetical protein
MSAARDPAVAAAHVRFAPKATGLLRGNELPLSANRVPMHRNKGHLKEGALDHLALFVRQNLHPMIGQKMTASGHMLGRAAVVSRPGAHHNYTIQTSLI